MIRCHRAALLAVALTACADPAPPAAPRLYRGGNGPLSRASDASMIEIPAGHFIAGSLPSERENAYRAYEETAGHDAARRGRWFEREQDRRRERLPAFRIDSMPVTMGAYAEFVTDTRRAAPTMDAATWKRQGFSQKFEPEVVRYIWSAGVAPAGREQQPVVLVSWAEARDYCRWRGELTGKRRRLPTALEFEKAARGTDGANYPWGATFDASKLNSQVAGPDDLVDVGSFPRGVSPFGVLGMAGSIFHWTSTRWPHREGEMTVKGSAWDDYGGVGRGASAHGRPATVRHAIVGFRCAG